MPLSEHEQRLLDQIERALYQEDPKFASAVRQTDLRTHMRRRLRRAAFVLVLGFALLFAGVVSSKPAIGIVGFVVMVGALLLAMTSWKRLQPGSATMRAAAAPERSSGPTSTRRIPRTTKQRSDGSFKDRIEQRWKRRWEERGGPE